MNKEFYRVFSNLKEIETEFGVKQKVELNRVGVYDSNGKWQKWISFPEFHNLLSRSKVHLEVERASVENSHKLF